MPHHFKPLTDRQLDAARREFWRRKVDPTCYSDAAPLRATPVARFCDDLLRAHGL